MREAKFEFLFQRSLFEPRRDNKNLERVKREKRSNMLRFQVGVEQGYFSICSGIYADTEESNNHCRISWRRTLSNALVDETFP